MALMLSLITQFVLSQTEHMRLYLIYRAMNLFGLEKVEKNLWTLKKSYFHLAIQRFPAVRPMYLPASFLHFFSVQCSFSPNEET